MSCLSTPLNLETLGGGLYHQCLSHHRHSAWQGNKDGLCSGLTRQYAEVFTCIIASSSLQEKSPEVAPSWWGQSGSQAHVLPTVLWPVSRHSEPAGDVLLHCCLSWCSLDLQMGDRSDYMLGTGHPLRTHCVSIPSSDLTPRRKWEGHGLSTCSQGLGGRGRNEGSFLLLCPGFM